MNKIKLLLLLTIIMIFLSGCSNSKNSILMTEDNNKLSNLITSSNYGEYLCYPIDLNDDGNFENDWKIFYNDGDNIFIISSEVCKNNLIEDNSEIEKYGEYNIYWDSKKEDEYQVSDILDYDICRKFEFNLIDTYGNNIVSNRITKVVATLFDQNIWKKFIVSDYADSAIGSPTIEMFCNSWNSQGYSQIAIKDKYLSGYKIVANVDNTNESINVDSKARNNSLYFPSMSQKDGCLGYRLASPIIASKFGTDLGVVSSNYWVSGMIYYDKNYSYRPVVCLKNTLKYEKNNNIWYIVQ